MIDLEARYQISPNVSLRPERFGALAYSFDTRKLSFLKHPDLVRVVESLKDHESVRLAFGMSMNFWGLRSTNGNQLLCTWTISR